VATAPLAPLKGEIATALVWSAVDGAAGYVVETAKDAELLIEATTTTTTTTTAPCLTAGDGYWRVFAVTADGFVGASSQTFQFRGGPCVRGGPAAELVVAPASRRPSDRRAERRVAAVVVVAACAFLGLRFTGASGVAVSVDDAPYDFAQLLRSKRALPPDPDIAVVIVNDYSLHELRERWPLQRRTWAALIDAIASHGPAAIVVDVWFEAPEPQPGADLALDVADRLRDSGLAQEGGPAAAVVAELEKKAEQLDGDRLLASSVARSGRVILGFACTDSDAVPTRPEGMRPLADVVAADLIPCKGNASTMPSIAVGAHSQASVSVSPDDDGYLRRYSYAVRWDKDAIPTLAAAGVALGRPAAFEGAFARLREEPQVRTLFSALREQQFTTVPASDLLVVDKSQELTANLHGRIVFVGVTALGTEDTVTGAFHGGRIPGVFVHAGAARDLLNGSFVTATGPHARVAVLLGILSLLLAAWALDRAQRVVVVVGFAVVAAAGWSAIWWLALDQGALLPWLPVVLGVVSVAAVRLGFRWAVDVVGRRRAQAQRERLLVELQARNRELAESLDTLRRTRSAKERMESELQIGREIQRSLLPRPLSSSIAVEICADLIPAREVGGDLYDFAALDDDHVFVVVGDVSGKGVGPALFMAMTQTMLKTNATSGLSPGELMSRSNEELARNNDACMFVTVVAGILNVKTGHFTWTNAGHNPPWVRRANGKAERIADRHGPALAVVEGVPYGAGEIVLQQGDVLLLYTDGITEAMNSKQELYGEERLRTALEQASDDPTSVVDVVLAEVRRHEAGAPQADDITLLALRLKP
jgi:serine phosphatase RsbU (regulator of sigma subunit)/CHASE2 domain-containing sensor protein